MRVVVYLYEPSDGGLDRVAILLANDLLRRGIAVEMWMGHTEGPLKALIDPAMPIRRLPTRRGNRRLAMLLQFPFLVAMLRRHRPHVIYSAGNQSNRAVGLAALLCATKAVGRISNPIVKPGRSGFRAWARTVRYRAIARVSAMTIVMGEGDRRTLAAPGPLAGQRVTLLPRPTVTPAIEAAAAQRRPRREGEPWRLLMVGRLMRQKGHLTALRALATIHDRPWRLRIAGRGPLQATLEEECARLGIADKVEFLGFIADPAHLAALLADSDLLLQPSLWEGLAGALGEALGAGAGVVATDSSPNIHALLADAGQHPPTPIDDVPAFARAILWSMDNPAPPERIRQAVAPHRVGAALDAYVAAITFLGPDRSR